MSDTLLDYIIEVYPSEQELAREVSARMKHGYRPVGGVFVFHNPDSLGFGKVTFYQAMVYEDKQ